MRIVISDNGGYLRREGETFVYTQQEEGRRRYQGRSLTTQKKTTEITVRDDEWKVNGIIDAIVQDSGKLIIIERKESFRMSKKPPLQHIIQAGIYASILQKQGYEISSLYFLYLGGDLLVEWEDSIYNQVEELIRGFLSLIETEEFPPVKTSAAICQQCSYYNHCF